MATVREIAKRAGVSPSTVSRALNTQLIVKESTRLKIQQAKEALDKEEQRSLYAKDYAIGIIVPSSSAYNISEFPSIFSIITSFVESLSHSHASNTTLVYDPRITDPEKLFETPLDGYMIIGSSRQMEAALLPVLNRKQIPHVLINRHTDDQRCVCVTHDDEHASAMVVQHLLAAGHQRIVFGGGDSDHQSTMRRLSGYEQALVEAGIPVRKEYILFGAYSKETGYDMGRTILAMKERPTAAYFSADSIALGCMQYLQEHGMQLPQELAIVGFGNTDMAQYVTPKLTTVSPPTWETGAVAASALLQMMETPSILQSNLRLKTTLILRESSAAPPKL